MEKNNGFTGECSFDELEAYFREPEHLAGTVRAKMPPANRAKQFAPFAAVTGLDKALRAKEAELQEEYEKK